MYEHEHFCKACFQLPFIQQFGQCSPRGWWKCPKHPCLEPRSYLCPKHRDGQRALPTLSVEAGMALVDAICDKGESLSPRHTHSDVQGTVYGGLEGDY
jgi:hypothetical protein